MKLQYCFTDVNCFSILVGRDLVGRDVFSHDPKNEPLIEVAQKEFTRDPNLKGLLMNYTGEPFIIARIK